MMMKPDTIGEVPSNWRELLRGLFARIVESLKPKRADRTAFHCSAEWHLAKLGKHAALIHSLMLHIQTDRRDFYGSVEQIAEYFDADARSIRKTLHALLDAGFVAEIETRVGQSTIYRAIVHTEWAKKHPGRCAVKKEKPANPSQNMGEVAHDEPLSQNESGPLSRNEGTPSHKMYEPLPRNESQVSEVVSEVVSEKFPKGGSGGENSANSLSVVPLSLLRQTEHQEPKSSRQENPRSGKEPPRRIWAHRIWTEKTRTPLAVRKTDLARLEREVEKFGERKMALAWHSYVNAEPCPYNLDAVEIAVKRRSQKTGHEWLEGAEDSSQITRFPLAAFFAVADGYLVAAENPDKRTLERVNQVMGIGALFTK